jgi:hypothetical protein
MKIQLNDNVVAIREDFTLRYVDSVENLSKDGGSVILDLPKDMVAYSYDSDAKILVYYDKYANAFPVPGETTVPQLDLLTTSLPSIVVSKVDRVVSEAQIEQQLAFAPFEAQRNKEAVVVDLDTTPVPQIKVVAG